MTDTEKNVMERVLRLLNAAMSHQERTMLAAQVCLNSRKLTDPSDKLVAEWLVQGLETDETRKIRDYLRSRDAARRSK